MKTERNKQRFTCISCGGSYACYYTGTLGHAPQNICYDCWLAWRLSWRRSDDKRDIALAALADGATRQAAARMAGIHVRTLRRWLRELATSQHELDTALKRLRGV